MGRGGVRGAGSARSGGSRRFDADGADKCCLRRRIAHAVLQDIEKVEDERILKLNLLANDEFGKSENYTLAIQLTGRSSNLFLLDGRGFVLDSLRETFGDGQEIATSDSE